MHDFFSEAAGVCEAADASVFAFFFLAFGSCAFTFIERNKAATANTDAIFFMVIVF